MGDMNKQPPPEVETLAQRLRWAREARGMTQSKLAMAADVSTSTVGMIESAARINKGSLPQLADALGVNFKWLLHGVGDVYQVGPEATVRLYEDAEERRRRMMGPDYEPSPGYQPGPSASERNHQLAMQAKEAEFFESDLPPGSQQHFVEETRATMGTWGRFALGREVGRRKIVMDYMTPRVVAELSVVGPKGLPVGFERKLMRLALMRALDGDRPRHYLMLVMPPAGKVNPALDQAKLEASILGIDLHICASAQEAADVIKNMEQVDPTP